MYTGRVENEAGERGAAYASPPDHTVRQSRPEFMAVSNDFSKVTVSIAQWRHKHQFTLKLCETLKK